MDKEILKLFPQKAFKLIPLKETILITTKLTASVFDKETYQISMGQKSKELPYKKNLIIEKLSSNDTFLKTKDNGEQILKIYFMQCFDPSRIIHLDLRKNHFCNSPNLRWTPSKLHYQFSHNFIDAIRELYIGFYLEEQEIFKSGLIKLGLLTTQSKPYQQNEVIELFMQHFGEGKNSAVSFSIKKLQQSFEIIFAYFLKNNISLNPEFAVFGIYLTTLYSTLENIPDKLNVKKSFNETYEIFINN